MAGDYAADMTSLSEDEEEIASVIRGEADDVLKRGKATLEITPSDGSWRPAMCALRPADEAACPFRAQIDSPEQVTLYLGRYGTICELYNQNRPELLHEIVEYLRAVLAGRYRESVRLRDGELAKARAVLATEGAEVRIFSSSLGTIGRREPWQQLSYEPY
jgi:hypothetical protein